MSSRTRSPPRPRGEPAGDSPEQTFALLSIGALSRATGVPVETLRTWERRYDFPKPAPRGDTDHRRYPLTAVDRLRLVVRALDNQHPPSVVLRASPDALRTLVAVTEARSRSKPATRQRVSNATPAAVKGSFEERCTKHVLALDGEALVAELERAWDEVGGLECLVDRVGPFLSQLGTSWSRGEVEIGHEHFASEHVREFLSGHWRPMSERNEGPRIVCATVAGELHVLGLHMAATTLALAGARVIFLGANTPPDEAARAATSQRAVAVALSAAAGTSARSLERDVSALRSEISEAIPIVVGGAGFERVATPALHMDDLRQLYEWAKELPGPSRGERKTPILRRRAARR